MRGFNSIRLKPWLSGRFRQSSHHILPITGQRHSLAASRYILPYMAKSSSKYDRLLAIESEQASSSFNRLIYLLCTPSNRVVVWKLSIMIFCLMLTVFHRLSTRLSDTELLASLPGHLGEPVNLDKTSLNSQQLRQYDQGWEQNAFNQYVSDMIPLRRPLPDVRHPHCRYVEYPKHIQLPKTSIIMCFHNEAWSALLRSIHSILDRSPKHLVHELILVDDHSYFDYLKRPLDEYVHKLNNDWQNHRNGVSMVNDGGDTNNSRQQHQFIKIIRTKQREGLIRARLAGAKAATGEILTFLDSHIECTKGWLEPLIHRIYEDSWTVVCPVIDTIKDDTFEYMYRNSWNQINVGGFDWNLQFNWHIIPDRDKNARKSPIDPVRSPTMAGGLFSIDKAFFERLGRYDDGFEIWGGENLELSFKTWMCGGKLEILPCSHVGHIFRSRSPYQWKTGVNVLKKNSVRLAEVWMDEYKDFYYERIGNILGDFGNITDRKQLRERLQCKPFSYYVREVYPDLFIPNEFLAKGDIRTAAWHNHHKRSICLDGDIRREEESSQINAIDCHYSGGNQFWLLTKLNEIRRDDFCFDYDGIHLILYRCHGSKGNQMWLYTSQLKQIKHIISGRCLSLVYVASVEFYTVEMKLCNPNEPYQMWQFATCTI